MLIIYKHLSETKLSSLNYTVHECYENTKTLESGFIWVIFQLLAKYDFLCGLEWHFWIFIFTFYQEIYKNLNIHDPCFD